MFITHWAEAARPAQTQTTFRVSMTAGRSTFPFEIIKSIDDIILRKPGKFTPEEYNVMKCHSEEGARIVRDILHDGEDEYFEQIAVNVAHYHHEKWNGLGYPNGLKGEEIPLEARIMAIADVYDALVSKRVYKDEFSFEEANRIILENMGTHFDPNLEKYYLHAREKIEQFYKSHI